ncbi:MAG: hypothetical protein E6G27_17725 [Actinobacteria bacterium]|nr:MAG: hypothetical protein E6G27_17725 [Actinomycetota bacterium]
MGERVTTGTWRVDPAKFGSFVEEWAAFAEWASSMPGAGTLRLGRDAGDSMRFVSYAAWESEGSVRTWKASPEFRERLARVLQHVDDFEASELDVVATGHRAMSS